MSDEDVRFWRDWYDGKIYEADKKLGAFLTKLDKMSLGEKTIIIISSGSGNEFYEHKRFDHGYGLYDELIRVPLIIKIPGLRGRLIEDQVRMIDIMPTVLDLLNARYGKMVGNQMKGVSLIPLINGKNLELRAFSETDYLLHYFKRSLRTNDGWKFIYTIDTEEKELYNLKSDPYESNNLIENEPRIAYELEQYLFRWMQSLGQDENYHERLVKDTLSVN
jgi:arylsulfatase A-like enzyme